MTESSASGLGRRLLPTLFLALLVVIGMSIHADASDLLATLGNLEVEALLLALALAAGNYALRFLRWEYFLHRVGITGVPKSESALVFLAGFVLSITPGKVGELIKSHLLHRSQGVSPESSAPVVIAERLTDFIAVILLCVGGAIATEYGAQVLAWGASTIALLVFTLASERVTGWGLALFSRLPWIGGWAERIGRALGAMRSLLRPLPLFVGVGLGVIAWGLEGYALHVILTSFGSTGVSVGDAVFFYTFATLAGAVALLPAGLGVTEGSLIALVSPHLATAADATAVTLIIRFCTLWFAVALGLIALGIRPSWWTTNPEKIPPVDKINA